MQHATRSISVPQDKWPQGAIVQASLADSVYERLLAMVVHGALMPGDEIAAFAVAQQFGVSRTPVVEAIRRLVNDGLLEQSLNRTPRVATFTRKDIEDVYQMRLALESLAVENATIRNLRGASSRVAGWVAVVAGRAAK